MKNNCIFLYIVVIIFLISCSSLQDSCNEESYNEVEFKIKREQNANRIDIGEGTGFFNSIELLSAYKDDSTGANKSYKGKIYNITGTIEVIEKDIFGCPIICLGNKDSGLGLVKCFFSKDKLDILGLKINSHIIIQGKIIDYISRSEINGRAIFDVIVEDCKVFDYFNFELYNEH